jgi:hypothetical protein
MAAPKPTVPTAAAPTPATAPTPKAEAAKTPTAKPEKKQRIGSAYGSLVGLGQAMGYETGGGRAATAAVTGAPAQIGYRMDVASVTPQTTQTQVSPARMGSIRLGTKTPRAQKSFNKGLNCNIRSGKYIPIPK